MLKERLVGVEGDVLTLCRLVREIALDPLFLQRSRMLVVCRQSPREQIPRQLLCSPLSKTIRIDELRTLIQPFWHLFTSTRVELSPHVCHLCRRETRIEQGVEPSSPRLSELQILGRRVSISTIRGE
jgi:hypothetical protein